MRKQLALALGAAVILGFSALMAGSGYAVPNNHQYKYSIEQCNAAYARCNRWCDANRSGEQKDICQSNCVDYYARCMGARYRGTTPPLTGSQDLPAKREP